MTKPDAADPQSKPVSILKKFLNEEQDPGIVRKVYTRVSEILTSEEEILYIAVQNKPLVNIAPDCVVLTNRRFIIYKPKTFGRAEFIDYIWRHLKDARLKEGLMGATLTILTIKNLKYKIEYLPKRQARKLYAIAQEMEEMVREERRIRSMEEQRAAAGGVIFHGNPQSNQPVTQPAVVDPVQKLKQLKDMLDAELISNEEFETKKAEILSQM
jgi:hypothetical protein